MIKTELDQQQTCELDPLNLWYAPDRRLRNKTLADKAVVIAEWINTGVGCDTDPKEEELFIALHTCAYRAARRTRGKPIPDAERQKWARRWQIIREHIVEQNLGLVYSMISKFSNHRLDDDDMLSDGMFALTRAADRFNPWRGFRFSTYACNVIARSLMRRGKQTSNYRRLFPVQHDVELEQPVKAPDARVELYIERLNRAMTDNLGELTDIESKILSVRFLSDEGPRLTFREIGDEIGLSKERVRQIQNIALDKLRDVLIEDPVLS